jgi:hypothetical protein
MNNYKKILCPDCQSTLGRILPLECGEVSLELDCKKCRSSKKIRIEVRASEAMRAGSKEAPATERIFVG